MQVTPYCPITSGGKAPNLEPFVAAVAEAIVAAARKAQRAAPRARQVSQKDVRRGDFRFNEAADFLPAAPDRPD